MNLAIAYGIARQHNGWIDVAGDESGVTFEVYLPAADAAGAPGTQAAPAEKPRNARPLRVLLAEDDEDLRLLAARTLRKNGHEVFEADCAEKALEIFDSQKGNFDTLISDVVMPDKSGVDLANAIRGIKPDIDVILMSGYIDDKVHIDTIQNRGYKFIYKPFDVDAMLAMLRF
jgi:CheY-like chemotaxis protein